MKPILESHEYKGIKFVVYVHENGAMWWGPYNGNNFGAWETFGEPVSEERMKEIHDRLKQFAEEKYEYAITHSL